MRKGRRKQKRIKERAFGQSTEIVGDNDMHRWETDIDSLSLVDPHPQTDFLGSAP